MTRRRTLLLLSILAASACQSEELIARPTGGETADTSVSDTSVSDAADPSEASVEVRDWFAEIGEAAGFPGEHALDKSLIGRFQGGVCVFDADGDGRLDVLFPGFVEGGASTTRLLMGKGAMRWVDDTAARLPTSTGAALACLAFDVDGDGDDDLVFPGFGAVKLFRNEGGVFIDDSARLPAVFGADELFTAAVAFDADGDGDLDLAISSYGRHAPPATCALDCALEARTWKGGFTRLLFQRPDGSFEDQSARLGTASEPALVLLATDLDADGKLDLFVGNDLAANADRYFRGDGKGGFVDTAKAIGVAYSKSLSGVCSMSATDGDLDVDGELDLFESSFERDTDAMFLCKAGVCRDAAEDLELFRATTNLRWGQAVVDFDDDGVPELFEATGHLIRPSERPPADAAPRPDIVLDAPIFWVHRDPTKPFELVPSEGALAVKTGGRAVVPVDLDDDGDLDVIMGAAAGRPRLFENTKSPRGNALNLRLRGKGKNTHAVGARVTVTVGARRYASMIHAGEGYHGSRPSDVHVGLGAATTADRVVIAWPSGKRTELTGVAASPARLVIDEP